jgi:hypothetical protein
MGEVRNWDCCGLWWEWCICSIYYWQKVVVVHWPECQFLWSNVREFRWVIGGVPRGWWIFSMSFTFNLYLLFFIY